MPFSTPPATEAGIHAQAQGALSDPDGEPIWASLDNDNYGALRIANGRHDVLVHCSSGLLFVDHATVTAPIVAADFGGTITDTMLRPGATASPAISTERGGLLLERCTVEGDIVCNGLLGVVLQDTVVTGDIRSPHVTLESNVTVRGRVHAAGCSTLVGANCRVDVLEVSRPRLDRDFIPTVSLEHGAIIDSILCHAPAMKLFLEGDARVVQPLASCIEVKPWPEPAPDGREMEGNRTTSIQSLWTFGERDPHLSAVYQPRLFNAVPSAHPDPDNAP